MTLKVTCSPPSERTKMFQTVFGRIVRDRYLLQCIEEMTAKNFSLGPVTDIPRNEGEAQSGTWCNGERVDMEKIKESLLKKFPDMKLVRTGNKTVITFDRMLSDEECIEIESELKDDN